MRSRFSQTLRRSGGALALLLTAVPAAAQYQVVWEDNFDGNALDLTKWQPEIGTGCPNVCGWGNNESQYYRAENATVANGLLTITARRQNFGGQPYTSARLRTLNQGDWTYGRVEMRAKLPKGQGIWPAFWMLPSDYVYGGWAASGEIDVMELVGHQPNVVHGTLHYGAPSPGNTFSGNSYTLPSGDFSDDFHIFAVEWDEFEFRWYVDNVHYATQTSWWSSGGAYPAPFNQRFHMLLNLAVGGNWPGYPDGTTVFPQTYEIDYVRVLQEVENEFDNCRFIVDDMEHADPLNNGWFTFDGGFATGSIGINPFDLPPSPNNGVALDAGWSNSGFPGFMGGFGKDVYVDANTATHFEMWIKADPGTDGTIEINLQDDDNGDGMIASIPDGADDEFQYALTVGPPGSGAELIAGGGWQHVSIPITDFVDDNSFHNGGNGVWDPLRQAQGGNGQLIAVVVALVSDAGAPMSIRTDDWRFTERIGSLGGRVWDDIGGDGIDLTGEPGIPGVTVELIDTSVGAVVATSTSAADGSYDFPEVAAGSFEVRIDTATLPAGATPSFDPDGSGTSPHTATLPLTCGGASPFNPFGYDLGRIGQNFCTPAQPNSSGAPASIAAQGTNLAAANDFTLLADDLPNNAFGFFIVSAGQTTIPGLGGGQGTLCIGPSIGRAVGDVIFNSGTTGTVSVPVDLQQLPTPTGTVQVQSGETWYFQGWFRDVNPQVTSNLTDGVGVNFQ